MQAIVQDSYGNADVLRLDPNTVIPSITKEDQVLVKVKAAGVDPGVWHIMTGTPYLCRLAFGLSRPKDPIRGLDMAGTVVAIGAKVSKVKVGDEVFGEGSTGTFAEYCIAKEDCVALKPVNLTFEQAASIPVSCVAALEALTNSGQVQKGEKVLIIGAGGGIGLFAVQIAKNVLEAHVTGVGSTSKLDTISKFGADCVIDYTVNPSLQLPNSDNQYDCIIDIAGVRRLSELRQLLTRKGRLVMVGGEDGGGVFGGVVTRSMGAMVINPFISHNLKPFLSLVSHSKLQVIKELTENGKVSPMIAETFPLSDAAKAMKKIESSRTLGKMVLTISKE